MKKREVDNLKSDIKQKKILIISLLLALSLLFFVVIMASVSAANKIHTESGLVENDVIEMTDDYDESLDVKNDVAYTKSLDYEDKDVLPEVIEPSYDYTSITIKEDASNDKELFIADTPKED